MSVFGYSLKSLSDWWHYVPGELRSTLEAAHIADGGQYENMCKYIEDNASTFVAAAQRERQAVIIHPNDSLLRSLVVTPQGEFFLLLNRHSLGDKVIGKGGSKQASIALHLNTGDKYASSRCLLSTREARQGFNDELANNKALESAERSIQVTHSVSYTSISPKQNNIPVSKGRMFSPLCSGGSLDKAIGKGDLTDQQKLQIMKDTSVGLDEIHKLGIIHRDIKPGNILLHEGRAYIADFGTSGKQGIIGSSPQISVVATEPFLPPEVAFGFARRETCSNQNEKADVYALGVSFLELYGKSVYKHIDPYKEKDRYHQEVLQAAKDLGDAPQFQLIQRMVAIDPNERISSSELAAAMQTLD